MADLYLSKITLPSGTTYNIKDAEARDDIEAIKGAISSGVSFLGITTTPLTDGASTKPVIIDGVSKNPINGCIVIYGTTEFVWADADSKWHMLGHADEFKALAYKDSASTTYKPTGTVSQPTFTGTSSEFTGTFTPAGSVSLTNTNKTATVSKATGTATYTPEGSVAAPTITVKTAGTTTTINNPTSKTVATSVVAAAPGATAPANAVTYYAVSGETLSLYQLGYSTGASISTANVTVKNGDAEYQASAPVFTGTGARLVTGNISVPSSASFTGTEGNFSVSGTPSGTVSQPTFTGTSSTITVT